MHLSCVKASVSECVCCPESSLQWQWSVRGNRLELGPLTLSHAGTYTCVAKNSEGQTQRDYTLTVQGKEELEIWTKWDTLTLENYTHYSWKERFSVAFSSNLCPTQYRLPSWTLNTHLMWVHPRERSWPWSAEQLESPHHASAGWKTEWH